MPLRNFCRAPRHFVRELLLGAACAGFLGLTIGANAAAVAIRTVTSVPYNKNAVGNYSQAGADLGTLLIPNSPGGYDQPRDMVVDKAGNLQLVYGGPFASGSPYLATYNGSTWTYRNAPNWTLFGVTYAGAVATYENYVYAQSQSADGLHNGIFRFDTANNYAAAFFGIPVPDGGFWEVTDVTMGMDGWLYETINSGGYHTVYQINPLTMSVKKSIALTAGERDGDHAVVDAQGFIYASGDGALNKYSPTGTWLKSVPYVGYRDLDISSDGKLLTTYNAHPIVLDTELNVLSTFDSAHAYWGEPFVTWDTYQTPAPEPATSALLVGASWLLLQRRHRKAALPLR